MCVFVCVCVGGLLIWLSGVWGGGGGGGRDLNDLVLNNDGGGQEEVHA